jgi:putative FmdB family regulatory protein
MPIYEYRCAACGARHDALQKVSDSPLTDCPRCGAAALSKALTAAGFQLKGSGWYATDFKGGQPAARAEEPAEKAAEAPACGAGVAPCTVAGCPAAAAAPSEAAG